MDTKSNDTPSVTITLGWLVVILKFINNLFEATGGKAADAFGQSMTNEAKARLLVKENQSLLSKTTGKDMFKGANANKPYAGEQEGVRLNAWRLIWLPIAFLLNLGKFSNKEK